jgi:hypothetical protein
MVGTAGLEAEHPGGLVVHDPVAFEPDGPLDAVKMVQAPGFEPGMTRFKAGSPAVRRRLIKSVDAGPRAPPT